MEISNDKNKQIQNHLLAVGLGKLPAQKVRSEGAGGYCECSWIDINWVEMKMLYDIRIRSYMTTSIPHPRRYRHFTFCRP